MKHTDKVYIAGHRGLAGSAIWRLFEKAGYTNLVGFTSAELDLTDRSATLKALKSLAPDVVIDAAAALGGVIAGVAVLVDRREEEIDFGVPFFSCLNAPTPAYPPEECPLCAAGIPLVAPGRGAV